MSCQEIRQLFDLDKLGVQVRELGKAISMANAEAWADLAWFECVQVAEKSLPILVVKRRVLLGKEIVNYLKREEEKSAASGKE